MQNYGQAYKAILNEKFGDGIMSAIAFSTKVEKETDDKGVEWAIITLRGKWCVLMANKIFNALLTNCFDSQVVILSFLESRHSQ